jgi:hypothetical protein
VLSEQERAEQQQVERRCRLKKDRGGCGRQLCGQHEQRERGRVHDSRQRDLRGPHQSAAQEQQQRERRDARPQS